MKRLRKVSIMAFAFCVILLVVISNAQAATLNITVTDAQTGNQLKNVSVTFKPQTGDSTTGMTDTDGTLTLSDLAAGVYTITAKAAGYTDNVMTNVEIAEDGSKSVSLSLSSDLIELDKVSVTASRRKEKVLEAPASVALLDDSQIQDRVAMSVTEHLKSLRAVDVVTSGVGTSYVVVRGFNNVFSGNLLSLVDNRIASVPSLRVNAYTLIPTISEDIEQIEVVSGPGAALYGPNSANGVMHILTRSPFTSQGTTVSIGGGERRIFTGSLRHAGVINDMIGYKLTANYTRGDDWVEGRAKEDVENVKIDPIYDTAYARGELRLDYSPNDDMTAILSLGGTQASGIELTGIGAGQAKGWLYTYGQTRFIYKDLFAQIFVNMSDAGDTYVLRSGLPTIDYSNQYVGQIQHSYGLGDIQRFTYGLDVLLTRPDTDGTINGVNEDNDNINELGVYLQSETNILPQLKFLAAGRADNHNHLSDVVLSPRAAISFQPNDDHNIRLTYNRAFNTPGTSNLFLDILSAPDAFMLGANFEPALGFSPNIDIKAQGVPSDSGFTFRRNDSGQLLFRSPFSPLAKLEDGAYIPLDDPMFTNVMWGVGRGAILGNFESGLRAKFTPENLPAIIGSQSPEQIQALVSGLPPEVLQLLPATFQQPGVIAAIPEEQLPVLVAQLFENLPPTVVASLADTMVTDLTTGLASIIPADVAGLKNILRSLDPETGTFIDIEDVNNVDPLKPTITQTYEVGYKGILLNRLAFSADVYHSRINNFIGPLFVETPNVFLDAASYQEALGSQLTTVLADPKNASLNTALMEFDKKDNGGNENGTPVDELITTFASIPFGTVTPEQAADPNAVMLTYRNYGDISLNGLDLNFTFFLNPSLSLGANYSYVSNDLFENVDGIGDIALNAPKNKFGANIQYTNQNMGLGVGLRARYVQGFPVRSGVYVGKVESYYTLDVNAGYAIPLGPKPRLSLTVQNLLDHKHQQFVGTPEIGRLAMARLTQTF